MGLGFGQRASVDPFKDILQLRHGRLDFRLEGSRLGGRIHRGEPLLDLLHQGQHEVGSRGHVAARGLFEIDGRADDDVLRFKRRQQQRDVALQKFQPLRGCDRARQAHGARSGLADHGSAREQTRHRIVEFLLRHRPRRLGQDILSHLKTAAIDGETSSTFDQRGRAGTMVRRTLHPHGFRRNDHAHIGPRRDMGRFPGAFLDPRIQALDRLDDFLLGLDIFGPNAQRPFIESTRCLGQAKFLFQIEAKPVEESRLLRILRQFDEGLLLPHAQGDGMNRRGREGLGAAGGALLLFRLLVGILGALSALVPDLFDPSGDGLQRLEGVDRLLVETKDEKLAPMPYFSRITLNFDEDVLRCLGGKIHRDTELSR